jgi:hypothetical protein
MAHLTVTNYTLESDEYRISTRAEKKKIRKSKHLIRRKRPIGFHGVRQGTRVHADSVPTHRPHLRLSAAAVARQARTIPCPLEDIAMTESEFENFMASLRAPGTPNISPKRVINVLGIRAKDLTAISNPNGNVIIRDNQSTAKMQRCLRNLARILSAARINHDSPEQMVYWFMNYPLPQFYYRTAFELYADARTEELLSLLSAAPCETPDQHPT